MLMLFVAMLGLQMGFDQDATVHHFRLYADGGAIEVHVKNTTDTKALEAVRLHLAHIAAMFGEGNVEAPMLVHDTRDVPGIDVLKTRRERLTYRYVETSDGGRVGIVTTDSDALAALHAFLRYQIREHHTGDPETIEPRR